MRWLGTATPAAGEEVHVNVVDDLPPLGTAVHSEPVAALGEARRFAQRLRGEEAATQRLGVARLHRHDRRNVAPRDDQEVHRRHIPSIMAMEDRKSTRLNSSHSQISYAVFCLKKKKKININTATSPSHSCSRGVNVTA